MNRPKIEFIAYIQIYHKYLKYRNYYKLRENSFVFTCNRINGFVGRVKRKSGTASVNIIWHVRLRCGSLSITTPVALLVNVFDVRSVLNGQVSLAAVNRIYTFHESMNGYKNLKIHE